MYPWRQLQRNFVETFNREMQRIKIWKQYTVFQIGDNQFAIKVEAINHLIKPLPLHFSAFQQYL